MQIAWNWDSPAFSNRQGTCCSGHNTKNLSTAILQISQRQNCECVADMVLGDALLMGSIEAFAGSAGEESLKDSEEHHMSVSEMSSMNFELEYWVR